MKENTELKNTHSLPLLYSFVNWAFENILIHIRFFLLPFKLLTTLISWGVKLIWMLSNEYSKRFFAQCGRGVRIHGKFECTSPENLIVGDNVHINTNAFLRSEGGLFIGSNTHISRNLIVYTMNHDYTGDLLPYDSGKILKPVHIGKNVWLGINVVIAPGVKIGDGAIIGMGTVVAKDVPTLAIVGSAPQRILKKRSASHYKDLEQNKKYSGMSGYLWKDTFPKNDDIQKLY